MLAHRMVELRKRLGFDIFIASSELDRDVGEFAALIAQCQQARQSIETQATVHVQD